MSDLFMRCINNIESPLLSFDTISDYTMWNKAKVLYVVDNHTRLQELDVSHLVDIVLIPNQNSVISELNELGDWLSLTNPDIFVSVRNYKRWVMQDGTDCRL